jgi:peptidyl-prolyl cis-trans isomerase A (cyclophilin A)
LTLGSNAVLREHAPQRAARTAGAKCGRRIRRPHCPWCTHGDILPLVLRRSALLVGMGLVLATALVALNRGLASILTEVSALAAAEWQSTAPQNPVVVFETEKGAIEIEVDAIHAPITTANFLKYVDGGFYAGGTVNRAVRPDNTVRHDVEIQVIQFQIDAIRRREQFAPIQLERTSVTGLKHVDGAISMSRNGPDTATASFSIAIGDQPEMDFGGKRNPDGQGFAAFGRVVRGMEVVKAIHASPTGARGAYGTESLDPPIAILRAYRRQTLHR